MEASKNTTRIITIIMSVLIIGVIIYLAVRLFTKGLLIKGATSSSDVFVGTNPYGRGGSTNTGSSPNLSNDQAELDRIKAQKLADKLSSMPDYFMENGKYYKKIQVQCIKAPCPPVVVEITKVEYDEAINSKGESRYTMGEEQQSLIYKKNIGLFV